MSFLDTLEVKNEDDFNYKKHIIPKDEINKKLNDYLHGRIPKGYGINKPILDHVIVSKLNEVLACVGKKGRGKTTIEEILLLMWAMVNDLTYVLALQENDVSLEKMNLLGYIFGKNPKDVERENIELYNKGVEWLDNHFIFIDVDDFKTATEVTESLVKSGKKIAGLFLDPVNSFENGWVNTGNQWADEKVAAKKILNFSKRVCTVFLSQHPTMAGQRSPEDINSYSAEGGHFLNKSHFTWAINRDNGSNINRISVDNVRNKYTGGGVTHPDTPLLLEWHPYTINLEHNGEREDDIIQQIRLRYNPLKENFNINIHEKEIHTATLDEAFGEDETPF